MSTFDLGKIKFTWQGAYDAATTYEADDAVSHGGSSWLYINESSEAGQTPSSSNTAYWNQMAQGSDLGSISGLAAGSMFYYDGSDFVNLGIGTAGEFLKVNSGATAPEWDAVPDPAVIQHHSWMDRTSRSTANGGFYYFGAATQYDNQITVEQADSLIRIDVTYFGESNSHNTHIRIQYNRYDGSSWGGWTNPKIPSFGQNGHMKVGAYPDSDYNSTPHTNNMHFVDSAAAFGVTAAGQRVAIRMYHFNGGTYYHNRSIATQYESGHSGLTISEIAGAKGSVTWR